MILTYGCLSFEIERVYRFDNRAIYDESGVDYLYNHVVIGVQAVLHPSATVSNDITRVPRVGQGILGINQQGFGTTGRETLRDISTIAMQPRQLLTVWLGGMLVLQSPLDKPGTGAHFPCDAKGGPKPLSFRVIAVHGPGKTLVCTFEIETFVNQFNSPVSGVTPTLLSHRWTMSHDIDELSYTTRTISGTATYRKDYLAGHPQYAAEMFADDFRQRIFHAVPNGYKRMSVRVSQSSDGTQLWYTITDQEQTLNFGLQENSPVLRLQGNFGCGTDWIGGSSFISLPRLQRTLNITCWGRKTSTPQQLILTCARAAAAFKFFDPLVADLKSLMESSYNWDIALNERRVGLVIRQVLSSAGGTSFKAARGENLFFPKYTDDFPEGIDTILVTNEIANPRPPIGGARGTSALRMVAQSLLDPATVPPQPTQTPSQLPTATNAKLTGVGGY